jgi:predicted HAD superfamily Cof-like phosphohydrolase
MINKLVNSVRKFQEASGQVVSDYPQIPDDDTAELRHALITEETSEFFDAWMEDDLIGIADALGDIMYVVVGCALAYGIDLDEVMKEICRSNDTKYIQGKVQKDDNGKVKKPPHYSPPNLEKVIYGM